MGYECLTCPLKKPAILHLSARTTLTIKYIIKILITPKKPLLPTKPLIQNMNMSISLGHRQSYSKMGDWMDNQRSPTKYEKENYLRDKKSSKVKARIKSLPNLGSSEVKVLTPSVVRRLTVGPTGLDEILPGIRTRNLLISEDAVFSDKR